MQVTRGTYIGAGTDTKTIDIAFTPTMVWVAAYINVDFGSTVSFKFPALQETIAAPVDGPGLSIEEGEGSDMWGSFEFCLQYQRFGRTEFGPVSSVFLPEPPPQHRICITADAAPSIIQKINVWGRQVAAGPDFTLLWNFPPSGGLWWWNVIFPSGTETATAPENTTSRASLRLGLVANAFLKDIISLNANSFTVGLDLNVDGTSYYYVAFSEDSSILATGLYKGTGGDRNISVDFQPDIVLSWDDDWIGTILWCASRDASDAFKLGCWGDIDTDFISGIYASGFSVQDDWNYTGGGWYGLYPYICFKQTTGVVSQGTYTGDGMDDREVLWTDPPAFMLIVGVDAYDDGVDHPVFRHKGLSGDTSWRLFGETASNLIQILLVNGFQVGDDWAVNWTNGFYYYIIVTEVTGGPPPGPDFTGTFTPEPWILSITLPPFGPGSFNPQTGSTSHYNRYKALRGLTAMLNNLRLS